MGPIVERLSAKSALPELLREYFYLSQATTANAGSVGGAPTRLKGAAESHHIVHRGDKKVVLSPTQERGDRVFRGLRRRVGAKMPAGGAWAVAILLTALAWIAIGSRSTQSSFKVLIPRGYVGWISVEYGMPGTPPLPSEGGGRYRILRFAASGRLQTSSNDDQPTPYGVGEVQRDPLFYYYVGERRRPLDVRSMVHALGAGVWAGRGHQDVFIGTVEQYNRRHVADQ